jgi:hypothetical protein
MASSIPCSPTMSMLNRNRPTSDTRVTVGRTRTAPTDGDVSAPFFGRLLAWFLLLMPLGLSSA